jgi:hypothetical protein
MAAPRLLRALSTFSATVGDTEFTIRSGEVVRADHPAVKGREKLFGPAEPTVEQMTAAPGEKRNR